MRAYLNSASFPAESLSASMQHLGALRTGLAHLFRENAIDKQVMCSLRASKLALSPTYDLLADGAKIEGGRHRDTVAFFLNVLDQQTPAHAALDAALQVEMNPHLVEASLESPFDENAGAVLVACGLDQGVLLSLASSDRWRGDQASYEIMTATAHDLRTITVDNVCDLDTATKVAERSSEERARLVFENWSFVTDDALKAPQIDEWFEVCRRSPGLEQLIMRSVRQACAAGYKADGELVKKLASGSGTAVFEVRAYFNGSNNVRLLFGRNQAGEVLFGYGGQKTHEDWYDTAIPQAVRYIIEHG